MRTHSRHYLFLLFLFLFVIAAPATVLYTAGYRYSFEHRKILQTGLLSVESAPRGARLLLDDKLLREQTPAVIDDLLPGFHRIRLEKDGYLPWEKSLEVRSRQTTFAKNLVLFAQVTPVLTTFLPENLSATPAVEPRLLETIRIRTVGDQVAVMRQTQQETRVLAYVPRGSYRVLPSPIPETVLVQNEQSRFIFLLDATATDQPILLSAKAAFWQWSKTQNPRLLYSDGFEIGVYDPQEHIHQTLTRVSAPITGLAWHPAGNSIFYTQQNGLFALELDARGGRVLTALAQGADFRDVWMDARAEHAYFFGLVENKRGWFDRVLTR